MDPGLAPTPAAADAGGEEGQLTYRGWSGPEMGLGLLHPGLRPFSSPELEKHFSFALLLLSHHPAWPLGPKKFHFHSGIESGPEAREMGEEWVWVSCCIPSL